MGSVAANGVYRRLADLMICRQQAKGRSPGSVGGEGSGGGELDDRSAPTLPVLARRQRQRHRRAGDGIGSPGR